VWVFLRLASSSSAAPLDPTDFPELAASYSPGTVTLDTDALTFGPYQGELHDGVAVFVFGTLTLDSPVTVVGSRPLALLTTGDLTVHAPLHVSAQGTDGGPGGFDAVEGEDGLGPGPGEAHDVGTGGAFCGDGGDADDGARDGGTAYGDLLHTLEGGSSGGSSTDGNGTPGGGGGGALELGALGVLTISASIHADGAAAEDNASYAGGGGAGGGLLLHGGLGSTCSSSVSAGGGGGGNSSEDKGGGGGGGGCIVLLGVDDSLCNVAAAGGAGGAGAAVADAGEPGSVSVELDPDQDGDDFSLSEGDCNDNDVDISPAGVELPCDDIDQDCDGLDDCGTDSDGDGYFLGIDCDDDNIAVFPGAPEIPADGIDNDCDTLEACFEDADGDSLGEPDGATVSSDDLDCLDPGESANQNDLCPGADDRLDDDGDTVPDGCDLCPADPFPYEDDDGDGVCNADDLCGGDDAAGDTDGDGLCDDIDLCEGIDSDADGTCDDADLCEGSPDYQDTDSDGLPDGCDPCPADPADACGTTDPTRGTPQEEPQVATAVGCGCEVNPSSPPWMGWLAALVLARRFRGLQPR
jgi:hypothetical protein